MTDTSRVGVEHCLALKVMRLTKPTLGQSQIIQSSGIDLEKDLFLKSQSSDVNSAPRLKNLAPGCLMVLPQSFGNIYLGEIFSSYVCVHNDSTETCSSVVLRADLQTASQRINLVPGSSSDTANHNRESLSPGSTIDQVISHEVKELGTHILVCEVTYCNAAGDKLNFRKFFKFQVMKPLDVKTKFYNAESDEVYLEAQVQNITQATITMDRVTLEPSSSFTVTAVTPSAPSTTSDSQTSDVGLVARGLCLQSGDSWQYLFCLRPRPEHNNKNLKLVTNIGKLDIVWRTGLCDRGRLQTSQLQRLPPNSGDIRLSFLQSPSFALINTPIPLSMRFDNTSDRTVELDLDLSDKIGDGDLVNRCQSWSGLVKTSLGLVEPGGSTEVTAEVVFHRSGLQTLQGITCRDSLLKRSYSFNDQCQVFVLTDNQLFSSLTT